MTASTSASCASGSATAPCSPARAAAARRLYVAYAWTSTTLTAWARSHTVPGRQAPRRSRSARVSDAKSAASYAGLVQIARATSTSPAGTHSVAALNCSASASTLSSRGAPVSNDSHSLSASETAMWAEILWSAPTSSVTSSTTPAMELGDAVRRLGRRDRRSQASHHAIWPEDAKLDRLEVAIPAEVGDDLCHPLAIILLGHPEHVVGGGRDLAGRQPEQPIEVAGPHEIAGREEQFPGAELRDLLRTVAERGAVFGLPPRGIGVIAHTEGPLDTLQTSEWLSLARFRCRAADAPTIHARRQSRRSDLRSARPPHLKGVHRHPGLDSNQRPAD